ncbi:MAG: leucine--tRNA ligase [Patescibacteria group bacterium]|nr:leucine--tRNA ligase [Patescibacteria group bacterium]
MQRKYNHQKIERQWQKRWEVQDISRAVDFDPRPKFYGLVEFPYPSGEGLHVGHPRPYIAMDIICRKRRMEGVNVLFPIGFDAFGLPAENYAIKTKTHPEVTTAKNIATFTRQIKSLGLSFDWSRAFATTEPEYYRWTQWIFLQLYHHGLAYRAEIPINWCPNCKIGLANEEAAGGKCERCGGAVVKRTRAQWLLKITAFAERLIDDLKLVDYPERVTLSQLNWIGRSEGSTIEFRIPNTELRVPVFTTRPDTLFGVTFMVVAPEHPLVGNPESGIRNREEVQQYVAAAQQKSDLERTDLAKGKTGVRLEGVAAVNPATGKEIPIFVADYVLATYGTGAIMGVPAHDQRDFDFAKQYGLPVIEVIIPKARASSPPGSNANLAAAYEAVEDGALVNSGEFSGLTVAEAVPKINAWLEYRGVGRAAVTYKLRDWVFSRQRYWGEPIPLVYCHSDECRNRRLASDENIPGVHMVVIDGREHTVVPLDEEQLPLQLPKIKNFLPTDAGESPLANVAKWVRTTCPRCGGVARRETDVMPNWAGSNWYYLRYCDPTNAEALADPQKLKYWMGMPSAIQSSSPVSVGGLAPRSAGGVDWYNGGMEHTTLHLLYSRFIYKFLWDIGAVPKECGVEPYRKRTSHGLILGEGGAKMSKSRGNVVNPDTVIDEYGADVLRLYEMFIGPFDQPAPWDTRGIAGVRRYVEGVFAYVTWWVKAAEGTDDAPGVPAVDTALHQTIRKVSDDIEAMHFNTAVSQLMIFHNTIEQVRRGTAEAAGSPVTRRQLETYLQLLAPFAPHLAEELWTTLGHRDSMLVQPWPRHDPAKAQAATVTVVVQVNGRVRDRLSVAAGSGEADVVARARQLPNVEKHLANAAVARTVYVADRLVNFVTR